MLATAEPQTEDRPAEPAWPDGRWQVALPGPRVALDVPRPPFRDVELRWSAADLLPFDGSQIDHLLLLHDGQVVRPLKRFPFTPRITAGDTLTVTLSLTGPVG